MPSRASAQAASLSSASTAELTDQLDRVNAENANLGAVIRTLGASLDLERVLAGVVTLLSDATSCHGCFVYSLEAEQLVLRAASPQYRALVDELSFGIDEGLVGWVARTGEAEFIREAAMDDPRMKVIPELEEQRYQSLVAAPIIGRDRSVIGVMSLHTIAPREFEPEVLDFLVSSGVLIGGAIENARTHTETQRHVRRLTTLAEVSASIAACGNEPSLCDVTVGAVRDLFEVASCQIYLAPGSDVDDRSEMRLAACELSADEEQPADAVAIAIDGDTRLRTVSVAKGRSTKVTVPLCASDEQIGLLVATDRSIAFWQEEERELLRALANLVSIALERIALIERLASQGSFGELIEAFRRSDSSVAITTASALGVDLRQPHVLLVARLPAVTSGRAHPSVEPRSPSMRSLPRLSELRADLALIAPDGLGETSGSVLTLLIPLTSSSDGTALVRSLEPLALRHQVAIGLGPVSEGLEDCAANLDAAESAAKAAAYLHRAGGVVPNEMLGAYRLLVKLDLETVVEDERYRAVARVADYDLKHHRRSELVLTLEQYLAEGRRITASARALYVHPNTLRQRLARIEALSGLTLASEDPLALSLAVKLVRLNSGLLRSSAALPG